MNGLDNRSRVKLEAKTGAQQPGGNTFPSYPHHMEPAGDGGGISKGDSPSHSVCTNDEMAAGASVHNVQYI